MHHRQLQNAGRVLCLVACNVDGKAKVCGRVCPYSLSAPENRNRDQNSTQAKAAEHAAEVVN